MRWWLLLLLPACGPGPVRFLGVDGAVLRECTDVEEATTAEARRRGLGGRSGLTPAQVLVLRFPAVDEVCITNATVSFPIAATFAGPGGQVVATERFEAAAPGVRCHRDVLDVFETDATLPEGVARVSPSPRR